jgi:hypothetical protein
VRAALLLLPLLLAGCGGAAYDLAAGPVIYECYGKLNKVAMLSVEGSHRAYLKLDGKAGTFAEWSSDEKQFIAWPEGKLTLSGDKAVFAGAQREGDKVAKRSFSFDRRSGHLSDRIDLGEEGKFAFEATCSPRPSAPTV